MVSELRRNRSVPHQSVEEPAREQGIPDEHPDYVAFFSKIWRTKEEGPAFRRYIPSLQRPVGRSSMPGFVVSDAPVLLRE